MSNVVSPDTTQRLRWHAGLEQAVAGSLPTISDCTRPASALATRLEDALADFVATLEQLNHELNGDTPSQTITGATEIPRAVAYAISEVARALRDAGAAQGTWTVETAWSAVLAGDIDDLQQHLNEERALRQR
jgi:hypothetical protein